MYYTCIWCGCSTEVVDEDVQRVLREKGVREALLDPEIQLLIRCLREDSRKAQKYVASHCQYTLGRLSHDVSHDIT